MAELVCIGDAAKGMFRMTEFDYAAKKRSIFANLNEKTERISNGMIYCKKCYYPKMADFPERNFVTRCLCDCEAKRREREWERTLHPPKPKELRQGDWNPFD